MNKGEIFWGRKDSDAIHPIVYLRDRDNDFFVGAMLTTTINYPDKNLPMEKEHFKKVDREGVDYKLYFNNTLLVKAKLLKRMAWEPFKKIGELTEEGIKFVELNIDDKDEKLWEDYLREG